MAVLVRPPDFAGDDDTAGGALSIIFDHAGAMLHCTSADLIDLD